MIGWFWWMLVALFALWAINKVAKSAITKYNERKKQLDEGK